MKSACHKGWSRLFGVALMTLTLPAIAQENRPPKVDITSPPRGAHFTAPADLKLIAQTADADGWVGTVAFFSGDTKIGESVIQFLQPPKPGTLIVHELQWRAEKPGVYHFTAVATDDGGAMTTTDPIEIILDPVLEQALVNWCTGASASSRRRKAWATATSSCWPPSAPGPGGRFCPS